MPKLDAKTVQKEIEADRVWPVYWLYGPEKMKSRELLKRIRAAVLGSAEPGGFSVFAEEECDAAETSARAVVEAAQALSLGGGGRLVVLRDAHLLKEPEPIAELFGPALPASDQPSVLVCLSKDLDGRRKFSKLLVEKAAVVECADVVEVERGAWIGYLAQRLGIAGLPAPWVERLKILDPWTLDIVERELEILAIDRLTDPTAGSEGDARAAGLKGLEGADVFFEAFFARNEVRALECAATFAAHPDEALPLLGLFGWNVRQLALSAVDREQGSRSVKLSPFLADRFKRWVRNWNSSDAKELQARLAEIDFSLKQTPRLPLGLWGELIVDFCKKAEFRG